MKKALIVAVLVALPGAGATASGLRMTVEQPHFTCEGHDSHFSHVSYTPGQAIESLPDGAVGRVSDVATDDAAPLPCCDGKIGCAQFLSTNTIIRQATEWHG